MQLFDCKIFDVNIYDTDICDSSSPWEYNIRRASRLLQLSFINRRRKDYFIYIITYTSIRRIGEIWNS